MLLLLVWVLLIAWDILLVVGIAGGFVDAGVVLPRIPERQGSSGGRGHQWAEGTRMQGHQGAEGKRQQAAFTPQWQ